jgi:Secretion system C-terminal sorting domain
MKRFIAIVPILLMLVTECVFAQATCTLDCCNECFPYYFCVGDTQLLMCSNSPLESGHPAMSFIPSCVTVDAMPAQGLWQPQTGVPDFTEMPPTQPNKEEIYERYVESAEDPSYGLSPPPFSIPYDVPENAAEYWGGDPAEYTAGLAQWNLDSSNFFSGLGWALIDTSSMDDENAIGAAVNYFEQDYGWLFEEYDNEESAYTDSLTTYETDSTTHFTGHDVPYTQIWNQTNADSDANKALHNWLNICSPPVPPSVSLGGCCLHIVLDTNAKDFEGPGSDPIGTWASTVGGWQQSGFPACDDTSACPTFVRYIDVNISYDMFEQTTNPIVPNPVDTQYILHSVPQMGFYTSQSGIPSVFTGFSSVSFYTLMEHEIGHFLGLHHPDETDDMGTTCSNCYTENPPWVFSTAIDNYIPNIHAIDGGFQTIMGPIIKDGTPPRQLTIEDTCQFQKLYCPEDCLTHGGLCALDGVSQQNAIPQDWFNPEVFPNPSNGDMTLTFTTIAQSLTQISIYDMLGNNVKEVSNGYLNVGQQTISLGTETLPSGSYVCRVRVGDRVSYINLAITK